MEHFQLPDDIISNIKLHAHRETPRESCGVIVISKGKRKYIECENVAAEKDCFKIDHAKFSALSLQYNIECVVHSHTTGNTPSEHDVTACNNINIPYLVYYNELDEYEIIYPPVHFGLIGRTYEFGVKDCFEASRDWYLVHGVLAPPRRKWIDNWWQHNYNYIEDEISDWPFNKVKNPKYGDLVIFKVESSIPNHMGVYVGNDEFYHHAVNRLSCVENMYPFWAEFKEGIYRYDGSPITRRTWR